MSTLLVERTTDEMADLAQDIIAIELEEHNRSIEDAKNVLVTVFMIAPEIADAAIQRYLYSDAT